MDSIYFSISIVSGQPRRKEEESTLSGAELTQKPTLRSVRGAARIKSKDGNNPVNWWVLICRIPADWVCCFRFKSTPRKGERARRARSEAEPRRRRRRVATRRSGETRSKDTHVHVLDESSQSFSFSLLFCCDYSVHRICTMFCAVSCTCLIVLVKAMSG